MFGLTDLFVEFVVPTVVGKRWKELFNECIQRVDISEE